MCSIKETTYTKNQYYQFGSTPLCCHGNIHNDDAVRDNIKNFWKSIARRIQSFFIFVIKGIPNNHSTCERCLPRSPQDSETKIGKYCLSDVRITEATDEGLLWKKKFIASAQNSIEFSPNFAGGREFQEILFLISERMARCPDLKVHIILNSNLLESIDEDILSCLKQLYGDKFQYLISDAVLKLSPLHTEENHTKMLVVDSAYFVIGGSTINPNLAHEQPSHNYLSSLIASNMPKSSRDTDLVGHGVEIARTLRKQFFRLYRLCEQRTTKRPASDRFFIPKGKSGICPKFHASLKVFKQVKIKVLVGGPEHREHNPITNEYVKRIKKCLGNITFGTLFFHPDKQIANALRLAKLQPRCRHISLITNGITKDTSIFMKILTWMARKRFHLVDAVYEYQGTKVDRSQLYHKKVAVFGNTHAMIGSYNLGKKSSRYDFEIALVIKNEQVVRKFNEGLATDKERSIAFMPRPKNNSMLRKMTTPLRKLICQFY